MRRVYIFLIVFITAGCASPDSEWTYLFNGRDLNGWDTWLAVPNSAYSIPDYPRDTVGNYTEPFGLNHDPLNVFNVYDMGMGGSGMLNITGKVWGAITTREEYGNFHLSLEYMWGEKRWAPRDSAKRDSGILYFCVGEHGAGSGAWMRSQECQVQEGDTGDYWSVAGAIADIPANEVPFEGGEVMKYNPGSTIKTIGKTFDGVHWNQLRCLKSETNEKPHGQWNHVEIYAFEGRSVHIVNGKKVMEIRNSRQIVGDTEVPLKKGKIQLQSEGAEIFFRNVKIRPITSLKN